MIDTVKIALEPTPWASSFDSTLKVSRGSKVSRTGEGDEIVTDYQMVQDEHTGLRIFGSHRGVENVEVSLPRLMYGGNGILLRESDCRPAYDQVLSQIMAISPQTALVKVLRLDLVWQFQLDSLLEWIACFRDIKHPKIRTHSREFFGTGLEWHGDKLHVRGYDKWAEVHGGSNRGNVLRLECQLRGKMVPNVWNAKTGFDFQACYGFYRRLILGFTPRSIARPSSTVEFLAWLHKSGILIDGERPLDVYLRSKCERQRRRITKAVLSAEVPRVVCDLNASLPENALPAYVDVMPAGGTIFKAAQAEAMIAARTQNRESVELAA